MKRTIAAAVTAALLAGAAVVGVNQLTGDPASWKGSLNASIQQAASGDTITVPPGSYPGETIAPSSKTLRVEAIGATFGSLTLTGVKNLTLNGVKVSRTFVMRPFPVLGTVNNTSQLPENILITNADLKAFLFRNAANVTLRDSKVGGQNVSTSGIGVPKVGGYPSALGTPYKPSTGIVIERVFFHDIVRTIQGSTHVECLFLDGGTNGVIVRDSEFTNCGVFAIFSGPSSSGGIANVTIERNRLDIPRDTLGAAAPSAINFKGGNQNVVIKNNSILGIVRVDAASYPGLLVQDNAIDNGKNAYNCSLVPAASFVSNTMTTLCGNASNTLVPSIPFVSASRAACGPQPWDESCFRNNLFVTSGLDGVPVSSTPPPTTTPTTPTVTTTAPTTPTTTTPTAEGWKGSLNASYAAAAPGATIEVPAGALTMNYPSEGAVKILPSAKTTPDPITFVCKGDGDVIFPEGQLVITARNVVIRGACFKMKKLWVGDPANGVSTANVTIDGVFMQMFDISGSDDVTLRNSDVGPSVASAANPRYAEPKVHSGGPGGGVSGARVLLENLTIHDIQTLDAVTYHTGGLWVGYGSAGSLTIRNSRFMRNAVYDIHVDLGSGGPTPNLTLEGNTFEYPVEPLSNANPGAETMKQFTELQVKCMPSQVLRNYKITGNSWQHGWNLVYGGCAGATYEGLTISGNTGGTTRNPAETTTVPPPPVTDMTPVPAACVAPTLGWKLPTRSTITLMWPSVPGATGYRLFKNGVPVATAAATATAAKFGSLPYADTLLGVAAVCSDGEKRSSLTTFETRGAAR